MKRLDYNNALFPKNLDLGLSIILLSFTLELKFCTYASMLILQIKYTNS